VITTEVRLTMASQPTPFHPLSPFFLPFPHPPSFPLLTPIPSPSLSPPPPPLPSFLTPNAPLSPLPTLLSPFSFPFSLFFVLPPRLSPSLFSPLLSIYLLSPPPRNSPFNFTHPPISLPHLLNLLFLFRLLYPTFSTSLPPFFSSPFSWNGWSSTWPRVHRKGPRAGRAGRVEIWEGVLRADLEMIPGATGSADPRFCGLSPKSSGSLVSGRWGSPERVWEKKPGIGTGQAGVETPSRRLPLPASRPGSRRTSSATTSRGLKGGC